MALFFKNVKKQQQQQQQTTITTEMATTNSNRAQRNSKNNGNYNRNGDSNGNNNNNRRVQEFSQWSKCQLWCILLLISSPSALRKSSVQHSVSLIWSARLQAWGLLLVFLEATQSRHLVCLKCHTCANSHFPLLSARMVLQLFCHPPTETTEIKTEQQEQQQNSNNNNNRMATTATEREQNSNNNGNRMATMTTETATKHQQQQQQQ